MEAVGLLDEFRNTRSVTNAVNDFKERQIRLSIQKALAVCRKVQRTQATKTQIRFTDRRNTSTDVTGDGALFSVGDSIFFWSADCLMDADYWEKHLKIVCTLTFEIKDWFKDPADILDLFEGETEIPGGKPYPIVAKWQEKFRWEGPF